MKILISGGSGFLGSALSYWLNDKYGDKVTITWLSRDKTQSHPSYLSIMDYDQLKHTQNTYDLIINLAGAGIADQRWTDKRKQQLYDSRIKPTQSLLDYIARISIKPKLMISGSAIGWYGAQGQQPLDENSEAISQLNDSSAIDTDFAHELCERWEKEAAGATAFGTEVVIVRTGVVIHPSGGMISRLITPFKMGTGGKLGDGKQIMSWISRDDWVRAVIFIIERHFQQDAKPDTTNSMQVSVYNLTSPNPVDNATFTNAVGNWLNRPTFMTLPRFVLKTMFGEMSTLLMDGQKVLPKALLDAGFEFQYSELLSALEQQA